MRAMGIIGMAVAWAACAQEPPRDALATRGGGTLGVHVSRYVYDEPAFARLEGNRIGVSGQYTVLGRGRLHTRLEASYSYAQLDYEGSGVLDGVPDYLFEVRALAGADLRAGRFVWAPYAGLGYRFLFNDLRGTSSTGAAGYRRRSQYFYAPVGVLLRLPMKEGWTALPQIEYDVYAGGRQRSYLGDTGSGLSDVTNRQRHGRGYRARLMFEGPRWTIGVWTSYWDIDDSDVQPIGAGGFGFEPANTTRESGVELRLTF